MDDSKDKGWRNTGYYHTRDVIFRDTNTLLVRSLVCKSNPSHAYHVPVDRHAVGHVRLAEIFVLRDVSAVFGSGAWIAETASATMSGKTRTTTRLLGKGKHTSVSQRTWWRRGPRRAGAGIEWQFRHRHCHT